MKINKLIIKIILLGFIVLSLVYYSKTILLSKSKELSYMQYRICDQLNSKESRNTFNSILFGISYNNYDNNNLPISYNFKEQNKNNFYTYLSDKATNLNKNNLKVVNNCINCEKCFNNRCLKCIFGFFINESSCVNECPLFKKLNVLTKTCVRISETEGLFYNPYSIGRCLNRCGVEMSDCSCVSGCELKGNCCRDYNVCKENNISDISSINYVNQCTKFKKLSNNKYICLGCKSNSYLINLLMCMSKNQVDSFDSENAVYVIDSNDLGYLIKGCDINNCLSCENKQCVICKPGFFIYRNTCISKCPFGYKADLNRFICMRSVFNNNGESDNNIISQTKSILPQYWQVISKSSCKSKCGIYSGNDCSCLSDCGRYGNCCEDFIEQCSNENSKESCLLCNDCIKGFCYKSNCMQNAEDKIVKGICRCKSGYKYDEIDNSCKKINENEDYEFLQYFNAKAILDSLNKSKIESKNSICSKNYSSYFEDKPTFKTKSQVSAGLNNTNSSSNSFDNNNNNEISNDSINNMSDININDNDEVDTINSDSTNTLREESSRRLIFSLKNKLKLRVHDKLNK